MLKRARLIHVTTRAEGDLISDISPSVPRSVVPCALYVGQFSSSPPGDHFRRKHLGGYDGPLVMFLGRITEKKGVDVLVRAFREVRKEHDCRLAIVGPDDSGLIPKLKRLSGELELNDRDVVFVGPVFGEDRLSALAAADVWALSSHAENFGIAVVEAAAAGCPVVISPQVNLAPDLRAADAGVIADATPEAFAGGLLSVLGDVAERKRLCSAAPRWAARYDWSVVGPQLLQMYREVIR
jgi:glycosyltransferase involved in cell wall biosynthesis